MRTVRSIPSAVDNIYCTIINPCTERARETGTVMVRNKCRVCNIYIITTIAIVPLQGIVLVVLDF